MFYSSLNATRYFTHEEVAVVKKRTVFLIIGGVLVFACLACLGLSLITSSSPSYKVMRTARAVAQATEAARPTDTPLLPKPTDTPLPTNTPKPTNTSEPTNTPQPAETPVLPTPSPTMTPSQEPTTIPDDFASGGLGLSQETWEQAHTQSSTGPGSYVNYDGERYSVIFMDGNIWQLERNFADKPTLDESRVEGASLIPEDSQLVETYSPEGFPELIVDLYLSESLKGRFESDVWIGGEPGNFIVIYGVYDDRVPRIVIGTGNNP